MPWDHGFGTKRVPLESDYFEVYNQETVRLIDLRDDSIERITANGIRTKTEELQFDLIIYATGWDALSGAFSAIDFRGLDGVNLQNTWSDGPRTYLGMAVPGFPNMFMSLGPHQPFGNIPRSIEFAVTWITNALDDFRRSGLTHVEVNEGPARIYTEAVVKAGEGLLSSQVDSWMTGVNKNLPGRQTRKIMRYPFPAPQFRKLCEDVRQRGYNQFTKK